MQHPDEGTIHSWLDGALPAEEAASLEAHVGTCQSCAAAVAEARGFIAASSRILTALDDVPRGVVPAVPQRKRDLRVLWRAAAAMLVVAGGSLVVMREGGPDATVAKSPTGTGTLSAVASAPPETPVATEGSGTAVAQSTDNAANAPPVVRSKAREDKSGVANERDFSARAERRQAAAEVGGVASGRIAADAAAPASAPPPIAAITAPAEREAPLKVVKVERSAGSRRTVYEIAPSQTVTLSEPEPVFTGATVASGVETTRIMLRGNNARAVPSRGEATPAAAPPAMTDSRTAADSVRVSQEAVAKTAAARPQTGAAFSAAVNTISWTEARTGKTLTLSGNLPVERLQEIRQRIERERAAAGAKP